MQHVRVPQDRVGVLIGEGGSTLREIESRVEVRLDVDSKDGSIAIDSVGDLVPGVVAPDVVRVAGCGFAPEDTTALLNDNMMVFELIDIDRHTRNKNDMRRQRGRLIGGNGHTRELMEELTGTDVVICGMTLGIIGQSEEAEVARRTVEMILDDAPHDAVYPFLERKHNELTQGLSVRQNNRDATADEFTPTRHGTRPHRLFTAPASGPTRPPGESHG